MNAQQAPANLRRFALTAVTLSLDRVTGTTTHELVEALTDPEGSAVLGIPGTCRQGGWCEIAVICRPDRRRAGRFLLVKHLRRLRTCHTDSHAIPTQTARAPGPTRSGTHDDRLRLTRRRRPRRRALVSPDG